MEMWSISRSRRRAAILTAALLLFTSCGRSGQDQRLPGENLALPEQANYQTTVVREGTYATTVAGTASVHYLKSASLSWEKSNACYRQVLVEPGQQVQAGEVLATFDIIPRRADKTELALQLERAREKDRTGREARLSAIAEEEQSAEGLNDHQLQIALCQLEKLKIDYEQFDYQSKRELARLEEQWEALEAEQENCTLLAPFDGVIDTVESFTPGDRVAAGAVLITMHDPNLFLLQTEENADELRYNMQVSIGGADKEHPVPGRVVSARNLLPAGTADGPVWIALEGVTAAEALGRTPHYECRTEELKHVLVTEREAVHKENGKEWVYVLEEGGIRKRYVLPGFGNSRELWILDGLLDGQSLIVD